jgi:hypothetical protein
MTATCPTCGEVFGVGQWYQCPHEPYRGTAVPDDVPGGFWIENAWTEPRKFYSQSAYKRALAADNKMLAPRWAQGSKHLDRWVSMDAQTLENARVLVSRQSKASQPEDVRCETLSVETRVLDTSVTVTGESD